MGSNQHKRVPRSTRIVLLCLVIACLGWMWWSLRERAQQARGGTQPPPTGARANTSEALAADSNLGAQDGASDRIAAAPEPSPADEEGFAPEREFVVHGRVLAGDDFHPLPDALVEARYIDGTSFASANSDESGVYRITIERAVPASIDVGASHDGFSSCYPERVETGAAAELKLDLRLRQPVTLQGQVLSARAGRPIAGAQLRLESAALGFEEDAEETESDAQGFYRFENLTALPPEQLIVSVAARGYLPARRAGLMLHPGARALQVDLRLSEKLRVVGRVIGVRDGEPIRGARITLSSLEEAWSNGGDEIESDAKGAFAVDDQDIGVEALFVHVAATGFMPQKFSAVGLQTQGDTLDLGRVALFPTTTLTGVVVDRNDGRPVERGDVRVLPAGVNAALEDEFSDAGTLADGNFSITFERAPALDATVEIEAPGYCKFSTAFQFDSADPNPELKLELEPAASVSGRVARRADDKPLAGARVRLLFAQEQAAQAPEPVSCDRDGRYRIEFDGGRRLPIALVVEHLGRRFACGTLDDAKSGGALVRDVYLDLPPPRAKLPAKPEPAK